MKKTEILNLLRKMGVVCENDHFRYSSGKHGSSYFNKDAIYKYSRTANFLYQEFACNFSSMVLKGQIDVIVAPAIGGVALEQRIGPLLSSGWCRNEIILIFAEDEEIIRLIEIDGKLTTVKIPTGNKIIKRGYSMEVSAGKRVLILEDVLTTGNSVRKVIKAVKNLGGNIIGLGVIYNRGNITSEQMDGVPIFSLLEEKDLNGIDFSTHEKEKCPLCKQGIPINSKIGKGPE